MCMYRFDLLINCMYKWCIFLMIIMLSVYVFGLIVIFVKYIGICFVDYFNDFDCVFLILI